jgi:hypothetical protein
MSRKLKMLGLVVGAVFAISAMSAQAAFAATEFVAEAGTTTGKITGVQTTGHVFTTNAGTVTCKVAHFEGTFSTNSATTQTVTPKYENCTAFGFIGVPIDINGCTYTFTAAAPGEVVVTCGTKPIEITVPGCTTTVGSQTIKEKNEYTNGTNSATGKMDVTVDTDVTGGGTITYNECGTVRTNGTYTGQTTVTATNTAGTPIDITVN